MKNYKCSLWQWQYPRNYIGPSYEDYYDTGIMRSRDSEPLTDANFEAFLTGLGGESKTVLVMRQYHFACGWVETILISLNASTALLDKAVDMFEGLEEYPVIDDELYSQMEGTFAAERWSNCYDLSDRVDICRRFGVSIFAARHDYIPYEDTGELMEYLITP